MLSCLPLFLGIRAQEHLGVGLMNLEPLRFVTSLGKLCIIELLLHEQIGIFRLQALDGGQLFQRQIVKRLLRCLVEEDVALMRIVVFLGIPGLAVGGVNISGLGIIDDARFQHGNLCHTALCCLYFCRQFLRHAACRCGYRR